MSLRNRWSLTEGAFERLLQALDPDRDRAGEKYELLRTKLIKFFAWGGSPWPEDHADESIDRLIRRLDQGEAVERLEGFAYGVARLVLLESRKERSQAQQRLVGLASLPGPGEELAAREASAGCLEACLARLPQGEKELILEYYRGDGSERIRGRKALAERLQVPMSLLRIRVHRIRARIETCLRQSLGRSLQVGPRSRKTDASGSPPAGREWA